MRYAVLSAIFTLLFALPVLADDWPSPTNSGGGPESPISPPPDVPEAPPPLTERGVVREWGGAYRFYVPPGRYVLEADPILPREERLGGLPTGDVGRELNVRPEEAAGAQVFYDPIDGPPRFEPDAPPGTEYVYITDFDTRQGLRFNSRDEAIYYLGRDVVEQLEAMGAMGYFPVGNYITTYFCSVSDCRSIEQQRIEENVQAWQEAIQAVENFVASVIDWVVSVISTVVDWVVGLFKGEES
jgi:hypothetical protein